MSILRLFIGKVLRYANKTLINRGGYLNEFQCKWSNKIKHL
jgi:hypothetical protein